MNYYIQVIRDGNHETEEEVVKTIGPYSSREEASRAEMGIHINLNHEDYYTMVVEEDDV